MARCALPAVSPQILLSMSAAPVERCELVPWTARAQGVLRFAQVSGDNPVIYKTHRLTTGFRVYVGSLNSEGWI